MLRITLPCIFFESSLFHKRLIFSVNIEYFTEEYCRQMNNSVQCNKSQLIVYVHGILPCTYTISYWVCTRYVWIDRVCTIIVVKEFYVPNSLGLIVNNTIRFNWLYIVHDKTIIRTWYSIVYVDDKVWVFLYSCSGNTFPLFLYSVLFHQSVNKYHRVWLFVSFIHHTFEKIMFIVLFLTEMRSKSKAILPDPVPAPTIMKWSVFIL